MSRPAARITDLTGHGVPASPGVGALNVVVGNLPAWRTILDTCVCPVPIAPPAPAPHGPEKCYLGSTTVLINNQMACRLGDILQAAGPPNSFVVGEFTVLIGDAGFGMATPAAMAAFAAAMRALADDWDSMTPGERLAAMQAALNDSLPPGMTPFTITPSDLDEGTLGEFAFENWAVEVDRDLLNGPMTEDRFAELANTLYHEGRHGEQWFNAAQHRAAGGESAEDLVTGMGIPQSVAEDAVDHPAPAGTSEGAMGESADTSVYGDRAEHREEVLGDDSDEAYDQYRALPEEEDAWRQGDEAEEVFRNTPSQP